MDEPLNRRAPEPANEEREILYHINFRRGWQRMLAHGRVDLSERIEYGPGRKIHVYSSLKKVLKDMDLHPDEQDKNRKVFRDFVESLPVIDLSQQPGEDVWYNSSVRGINLRPGRYTGEGLLPDPIVLQGVDTHAVVAGTTGSGKSVFLNNLILNMMLEYPPWELEMYLADFKRVELSRYMNKYASPHVRACAATSEIDYVQSLIQSIKDRMDDRQRLFSRLGITKIEDFRRQFPDVAVPRILFLVDEFQQLFLDATPDQKAAINDLVTSVTRLGRAQGVHLLFASQDMTGAMSNTQLSNFNVRFALKCNSNISNDILGNGDAVELALGQVISRTQSRGEERFIVPFADDPPEAPDNAEEYIYRLLKEFMDDADRIGYAYRSTQKFYDENQQLDMSRLEQLLEDPRVRELRTFSGPGGLEESQKNFMSIVLGRGVVYSMAAYNIENLFIDYAKNRCVLCISSDTADLAYFQKLVALNVHAMHSEEGDSLMAANRSFTDPVIFNLNPLVSALYPETEFLRDLDLLPADFDTYDTERIEEVRNRYFHYRAEELEGLNVEFSYRKRTVDYLRDPENRNARMVCQAVVRDALIENGTRSEEELEHWAEEYLRLGLWKLNEDDSNILEFAEGDLSFLGDLENEIYDVLLVYYRYKKLNIRPTYKLFRPLLVWITGIENQERLPMWFSEFAGRALDYNIIVMFFCTSGVNYDIKQASNYVFVAGSDPKLYEEYLGRRISGGNNGLKFYCIVKNTNQRFGFKKYRCHMNAATRQFINFDELFQIDIGSEPGGAC